MQPQASESQLPVPPAPQPTELPSVNAGQTMPVPLPSTPPAAMQQANDAQSSSSNLIADDGDLIEKEWVDQVQYIVATTRNDPFAQSKLFTKLKSDYMQKRYGKDLKSDS